MITNRDVNISVHWLQEIILSFAEHLFEPFLWDQFKAARGWRGLYRIYPDDIPSVRDTKSLLNLLSTIERVTNEQKATNYLAWMSMYIQKKIDPIFIYLVAKYNYQVYFSTDGFLTDYFVYGSEYAKKIILPKLISYFKRFIQICSFANLGPAVDVLTERVLLMERYQQDYLTSKKNETGLKISEEKDDKKEEGGFFYIAVKQGDYLLREEYKKYRLKVEEFDKKVTESDKKLIDLGKKETGNEIKEVQQEKKLVEPEVKVTNVEKKVSEIGKKDVQQEEKLSFNYYLEDAKDNDTEKNIKKFLNGIIGIKRFLDAYSEYQKTNALDIKNFIRNGSTVISELKATFSNFQAFNYKAILATESGPLTHFIKNQIKQFNNILIKAACVADQIEGECFLKEGVLVKYIEDTFSLMLRMTDFLEISLDHSENKRLFYKARMRSYQSLINDIDSQLRNLQFFVIYKHHPMADIPAHMIKTIQIFITKYEDSISMDRSNLEKYKEYLSSALLENRNAVTFGIRNRLELLANIFHQTIHSEIMISFENRILYLQKQKAFLSYRYNKALKYFSDNPFDFFANEDIHRMAYQNLVLKALKKHVDDIDPERKSLAEKVGDSKKAEKELKTLESKLDSNGQEFKITDAKVQLLNEKFKLSKREYKLFSETMNEFEKNPELTIFHEMQKNGRLSHKSKVLLDEINEIARLRDEKYEQEVRMDLSRI